MRKFLLPFFFLLLPPSSAFADSFAIQSFVTDGSPAPVFSNFDYDPIAGKFLSKITVAWDIVPEATTAFQPGSSFPFNFERLQGCGDGDGDDAYFAFLTGGCGPVHWSFYLNNGGGQSNRYEATLGIISDLGIVTTNFFPFSDPNVFGRFGHAEGTLLASPVSTVHPVPEPSSVMLLVVGLGLLLRARRSFPSP